MRTTGIVIALAVGALAPTANAFAVQPPAAANGAIGIQLLEAPKDRAADARAHVYVIDHVHPGAVVRRKFALTNSSSQPVRMTAYAGAANIQNGDFIGAPGRASNELTTWTSVTPQQATIPASGRVNGEIEIDVPENASTGERYGIVWGEAAAAAGAGGVAEVNRAGIRIYLSVGTGGEPASNFTVDSMTASRGSADEPVVTARVHNTGGRALDMTGSLKLSNGPGSLTAGPFPAKLGTTLGIGQTEPVTVLLDKALPAGPWLARLDLQSGLLKRAATATITFPAQGSAAPVSAKLVQGNAPSPWRYVVGGILVLLLIGLLLLFFLKRRSRPEDRRDLAQGVGRHG